MSGYSRFAVHPLLRAASGCGYSQPEARTALRREGEVTVPLKKEQFPIVDYTRLARGNKNPLPNNREGGVTHNASSCCPSETLIRSTSADLGGWPCSVASGACGRNAYGSHGAM